MRWCDLPLCRAVGGDGADYWGGTQSFCGKNTPLQLKAKTTEGVS